LVDTQLHSHKHDTIEQDLRPLNIGLVSAWQRAQDRERWKRTVETATLQDGHALDDDECYYKIHLHTTKSLYIDYGSDDEQVINITK